MSILELARTVAVVHFANLTILLIVDCLSSPVLDDQLRELDGQERNFRQWFDLHLNINYSSSLQVSLNQLHLKNEKRSN